MQRCHTPSFIRKVYSCVAAAVRSLIASRKPNLCKRCWCLAAAKRSAASLFIALLALLPEKSINFMDQVIELRVYVASMKFWTFIFLPFLKMLDSRKEKYQLIPWTLIHPPLFSPYSSSYNYYYCYLQ